MNWSRKKVQQSGHLIILLSDDILHQELGEDISISFDDEDVTIYRLPDWARKWKLENDDWWGGIPNKYESVNWLCRQDLFPNDSTLLFLDPDMLFTQKIDLSVTDDEIKAQRWDGTDTFMYPFIINYKTLKKIAPDYKDECILHRKTKKMWESEMFGLSNCVKHKGIHIELIDNLGRCTPWNPTDSTITSNLIHYPNEIPDRFGNKIFFKQDYTFNQTMDIEIQKARNKTDKILLNNIDQKRTDFIYWLKWYDTNHYSEVYVGDNGHLSHKEWLGKYLLKRNDIFDKSWEFISVLGDGDYYSIDIMNDDYRYDDFHIAEDAIIDKILNVVPPQSKLYIATNVVDTDLFKKIKNMYDVQLYSDVFGKLQYEDIDKNFIRFIEQLICSRSKLFIGNKFSLFSSYVNKLRGYMEDVDNSIESYNSLLK